MWSTHVSARGFSLLEVVAAVAIFAIGMVAVLGLFAPVTMSVAKVGESEAAARVADAVRARLQLLPFERALALIQDPADVRKNDANGAYNPNDGTTHPAVLFGKWDGEVGIYDDEEGRRAWFDANNGRLADAEKYFEIDLVRIPALSPSAEDAHAASVAFHMRIRWPAFVSATNGTAVQVGANPTAGGTVPFDHGRKHVLFFTGTIAR